MRFDPSPEQGRPTILMLPPSLLAFSSWEGVLLDLPLRASNEGLLRPRVARAQEINRPPSPSFQARLFHSLWNGTRVGSTAAVERGYRCSLQARSLSLQGWGLLDLPLRATFSPALPSDCFAIDFPGRAISPGEGLPTFYTFLKGSGQGCPLLRASSDHCFIVGALRARRAPGRSLPLFHNAPNVRSKNCLVSVICCWMSDCKSRAPALQSSLV